MFGPLNPYARVGYPFVELCHVDKTLKYLRRLREFCWAVGKHFWALVTAILGGFLISIPGWIEPLLSPGHAATFNRWVTVSPRTYGYLSLFFFGTCLLYASFLAWNEEYDILEQVATELKESKRHNSDGNYLAHFLNQTPQRWAEERSARATEELARQMRLQHETEVNALVTESAIGLREGCLRLDIALDVENRGIETTLHDWRITLAAANGYRYEVKDEQFLPDKTPSLSLPRLKGRSAVNLAYYSAQLRRGQLMHGWVACEVPILTTEANEVKIYIVTFDHLDRKVEILNNPLIFRRKLT